MTKVVIRTPLDIYTLLGTVLEMKRQDHPFDAFYRSHPGFKNWVECTGTNTYEVDSDLFSLEMMETLQMFKANTYCCGGKYEEGDDYIWEEGDCMYFMNP